MRSVRKTKHMESALGKKGFERDNRHHRIWRLWVNGRVSTVSTMFSHGATDYGINLLKKVSRQLNLTADEFDKFMDCPMDGDEYRQLMIDRGHVTV
jgi:hypothetical protein